MINHLIPHGKHVNQFFVFYLDPLTDVFTAFIESASQHQENLVKVLGKQTEDDSSL